MAFLIEEKRLTSPTSSAQVSAVIGPPAGMVMSRATRFTRKGSRASDRTKALSIFCRRTSVSRQSCSKGRRLSSMSGLLLSKLTEVTNLVQLLFVVAHAGLHQQTGDSV